MDRQANDIRLKTPNHLLKIFLLNNSLLDKYIYLVFLVQSVGWVVHKISYNLVQWKRQMNDFSRKN